MPIDAPTEWTETEQVENKHRTSTPTSTPTSVIPENENIKRLMGAIASYKQIKE